MTNKRQQTVKVATCGHIIDKDGSVRHDWHAPTCAALQAWDVPTSCTCGRGVCVDDASLNKTEDMRRALTGAHVTLNERPATISAAAPGFAVVRSLDGQLSAQWPWTSAWNICQKDGAFRI